MNHITIFSELTTGKLKNMLSGKCVHGDLLTLVQSVNNKVIFKNILRADVNNCIDNFDFQSHGYAAADDFSHIILAGNSPDQINISIKPSCYYSLQDDFTVTQAPDKKSNLFLHLFCDEFERIKKRALHFFATNDDSERIKIYALKNLQFVKTCFHNCKSVFHGLFTHNPAYLIHPDSFIYYYLNFFLIRVRLFYEKLFEHFIPKSKKTEKQLLAELFQFNGTVLDKNQNLSGIYLPALESPIVSEKEPENYNQENIKPQQSFNSASPLPFSSETIELLRKIPEEDIKIISSLFNKFNWLVNTNILGDILFRLSTVPGNKGLIPLKACPDDIASLFSVFFKDKYGHRMSKDTLKTILTPSRKDKRPKSNSPNSIDISPLLNDDE